MTTLERVAKGYLLECTGIVTKIDFTTNEIEAHLEGYVIGNPKFIDGTHITTSKVVSADFNKLPFLINTLNSTYKIYTADMCEMTSALMKILKECNVDIVG